MRVLCLMEAECFFTLLLLKKNVDDLYGKLFKAERKALSIEAIGEALKRKFQQQEL